MYQNHYHMLTSRSLFFPYVNLTQHFGLFTLTLQGFNWCFSRKATGSHRLFCPQTFFWASFFLSSSQAKQVHVHSRPQRPRFFWSAPRIATSGQVQRHSGFEWLCNHNRAEPIRFVRLDSEHAQSDGKSVNRGLPVLDLTRGRQRSRFLVLTKRSAASGDENGFLQPLTRIELRMPSI